MIEREIILAWMEKILEQPLHSKLHIPAESKIDAKKLFTAFRKEIDVLYKMEPEKASTLLLGEQYKDRRFWVILERVTGNPLTGFIKQPDGTVERVVIEFDPERDRRIKLMKEDGYTLEQVEDMEGPLSDTERSYFR